MLVSDIRSALQPYIGGGTSQQAFILTDAQVAQTCLPMIEDMAAGVPTLVLPCGEACKTIGSVEEIWQFLLSHHATRRAVLINIGGGVITDMGGFAAATYKRGMRFVNVPTTLLAMVDASIGGKTGVDFQGIKNAIGTFAIPEDTLIYPTFLQSLPEKEWLSGYAEMLKHALIADKEEWHWLMSHDIETGMRGGIADFAPHIAAGIRVKEDIVAADPKEQGIRRALNFGHTVGHAIEEAYVQQGKMVPHGYCVLWGMVAELYLSITKQGMARGPLQQLVRLMLEYYGRPTCNCKQQDELLTLMRNDKKNDTPTAINFTLLREIGVPMINQTATDNEIREALDYLFSL